MLYLRIHICVVWESMKVQSIIEVTMILCKMNAKVYFSIVAPSIPCAILCCGNGEPFSYSNDPRFFADLISVSSFTYTIGPDRLYFIKEYIPKLH